jgi:hypothetical protein
MLDIKKCGRRNDITPVGALLAKCGLAGLQQRVTHMLWPNGAPSADKRHYCYKRGVGWNTSKVTLSRPSVKYDVINGQLVTIPAGELGANGRIEPATVTRITNSNDKANWALRGGTEVLGL